MATSLSDLRRKIKSVSSTQKITSAMQLVAASKMQRAIKRATESRPYATLAQTVIDRIAPAVPTSDQPLFRISPVRSVLALLITTNRGLAGALNTQLLRQVFLWNDDFKKQGVSVRMVAVGAKGRNYLLRYAKDQLLADFPAPETVPDFSDASPIGQLLLDDFLSQKTDAVYLCYNHFVSTLRQEPRIVQFLPFRIEDTPPGQDKGYAATSARDILFEPSREMILETLIPRVLRSQIYQVMLEAHASEQSARMVAMKSATDNAGDLLGDLTLTYNGVRQAAITGELLDIAAGANALENI